MPTPEDARLSRVARKRYLFSQIAIAIIGGRAASYGVSDNTFNESMRTRILREATVLAEELVLAEEQIA